MEFNFWNAIRQIRFIHRFKIELDLEIHFQNESLIHFLQMAISIIQWLHQNLINEFHSSCKVFIPQIKCQVKIEFFLTFTHQWMQHLKQRRICRNYNLIVQIYWLYLFLIIATTKLLWQMMEYPFSRIIYSWSFSRSTYFVIFCCQPRKLF